MTVSKDVITIRRARSTSTAVPTDTMRDTRLSFRARGVLMHLLSYDNETLISTADLSMHGREGRDAVRTALAELREFGYVTQTRFSYVNSLGRAQWAIETVVSEEPLPGPENPSPVELLDTENPSSVGTLVTTPSTRHVKTPDTPKVSTVSEVTGDGFSGSSSCITIANSASTTSSDTSYLSAGQARPPVAKGWDHVPDKPKRPSARKRAEAAKAEDDSTDPFVSSSEDDDAPDEAPGSGDPLAEGRQQVASRRSTRAIGASEKLAGYFETAATPQGPEEAAGRFSKVSLAKNISAWRKQGTPDPQIRMMIETYWGGAFRRNLAVPAWRDFINQRGQLHGQSQNASTAATWEANRGNDAYWI
jgi:hypothetical protein